MEHELHYLVRNCAAQAYIMSTVGQGPSRERTPLRTQKEYALCVTDVALSPAPRHLLVGLQRDIHHDVIEHRGE
jgi:hypothetical protein